MPEINISVVIPAFNEETTLPTHFLILIPLLQEYFPDAWELIVVDDGSTDQTAQVVRACGYPSVRLLMHDINRGKGAALRKGVMATRGALVLMCDADMATAPETLRIFLDALDTDVDIVIGNRRSPEARIVRKQPLLRRLLGTLYIFMVTRLVGVAVADVNCGFKLFRGELARKLFDQANAEAWTIDIEILALAAREDARIVEVPVEWRDGDKTSVRIVHDTAATLIHMLQLYLRLQRQYHKGA